MIVPSAHQVCEARGISKPPFIDAQLAHSNWAYLKISLAWSHSPVCYLCRVLIHSVPLKYFLLRTDQHNELLDGAFNSSGMCVCVEGHTVHLSLSLVFIRDVCGNSVTASVPHSDLLSHFFNLFIILFILIYAFSSRSFNK